MVMPNKSDGNFAPFSCNANARFTPNLPKNKPNSKITLSLTVSNVSSFDSRKSSFVAIIIPKSNKLASFNNVSKVLLLALKISSVQT
ncbi:hypothetical protein D9M71_662450 [compost metagenome]